MKLLEKKQGTLFEKGETKSPVRSFTTTVF